MSAPRKRNRPSTAKPPLAPEARAEAMAGWEHWAKPAPNGNRLPLGNHPGQTGGKKGRSGRKPDWWRHWCRELLIQPKTTGAVEKILGNHNHPGFVQMWKAVAEYAYGKPTQPLSGDPTRPIKIEVVYSRE